MFISRDVLGMQIYESPWITVSEDCIMRRSWRERLFSWPWKPWVAEKTIVMQVPDKHVYIAGNNVYCHPVIARQIREQFPI